MKKHLLIIFPLIMILLSSCSTAVPEPPMPPDLPISEIGPIELNLAPSPIKVNGKTYQFKSGRVCLNTDEEYNNVSTYFIDSLGDLYSVFLKGLGYDVIRTKGSTDDCEMVLDLTFHIELLSKTYQFSLVKGSRTTCYSGISIIQRLNVEIPKINEQELFNFDVQIDPPLEIYDCNDIEDNPLVFRWMRGTEFKDQSDPTRGIYANYYFLTMIEELWGPRASLVLLGIDKNIAGLEKLQNEAADSYQRNNITRDDFPYFVTMIQNNPSYRDLFLYWLPQNIQDDQLIPILLSLLDKEDQEDLVFKELELLQQATPDEQYAGAASEIIFGLAPSYFGEEDFSPSKDILISLGPDVIPYAVWYLAHHDEVKPETVQLAVNVLRDLSSDGYQEQVAKQAGAYLCYAYYLMEKGEWEYVKYYSDAIPRLLGDWYPRLMNGSNEFANPIRFYKAWQKDYRD